MHHHTDLIFHIFDSSMKRRSELITHPAFIVSLLILIVNDHLLKEVFHNWVTGKLSDFSGLIVLPLFLAYLLPKIERWVIPISTLWFLYWKSPLSSGLIESVNSVSPFAIGRVIDYSDFIAFSVLPAVYVILNGNSFRFKLKTSMMTYLIPVVTIFSLCSTSRMKYFPCPKPEGTVQIGASYKLNTPKDTVLSRINKLGFEWKHHQADTMDRYYQDYYEIKEILVQTPQTRCFDRSDTIKNLTFYFYNYKGKEYLFVDKATFSDTLHISSWEELKHYSKMYDNITKDLFVKEAIKK